MQTALSSMNAAFAPGAIDEIDDDTAEAYRPAAGTSLSEALDRTPGTGLNQALRDYIDGWPSAIQAGLQAAIHNNLTREGRVPITFAWTPGYDYSLSIHDILDTDKTRGGITVLLTSRYPADPHPLAGASAS